MSTPPNRLLVLVAVITWVVVGALVILETGLVAISVYALFHAIDAASLVVAAVTTILVVLSRNVIPQMRVVTRHFLS